MQGWNESQFSGVHFMARALISFGMYFNFCKLIGVQLYLANDSVVAIAAQLKRYKYLEVLKTIRNNSREIIQKMKENMRTEEEEEEKAKT